MEEEPEEIRLCCNECMQFRPDWAVQMFYSSFSSPLWRLKQYQNTENSFQGFKPIKDVLGPLCRRQTGKIFYTSFSSLCCWCFLHILLAVGVGAHVRGSPESGGWEASPGCSAALVRQAPASQGVTNSWFYCSLWCLIVQGGTNVDTVPTQRQGKHKQVFAVMLLTHLPSCFQGPGQQLSLAVLHMVSSIFWLFHRCRKDLWHPKTLGFFALKMLLATVGVLKGAAKGVHSAEEALVAAFCVSCLERSLRSVSSEH